MNWFEDLFIDEAKHALNANSSDCECEGNTGDPSGVTLRDRVTGKKYVVYIENGKLTMGEKE